MPGPVFNRFAATMAAVSPRPVAARPGCALAGPGEKRTSPRSGGNLSAMGQGSKAARLGTSSESGTRFAHFAGLVPGYELPAATAAPVRPVRDPHPAGGGMKQAQLRCAAVNGQGRLATANTPELVADHVHAALAKATAPAKPTRSRSADTYEGLAANAVELAERLGVIK